MASVMWLPAVILLCSVASSSSSGYEYIVVSNTKSFDDAKTHCQQLEGGKLAEPEDANRQQELEALNLDASQQYYIGLRAIDETSKGVVGTDAGSRLFKQVVEDSGTIELEYIMSQGCYQDDPTNPDFNSQPVETGTTVNSCVSTCQTRGFPYAGIKVGSECYCGNSFGKHGPVAQLHGTPYIACDLKCTADPNGVHYCGNVNPNRTSVYSVQGRADARWRRGSPNFDSGKNQQCTILLQQWSNEKHKLDDEECKEQKQYLCEGIASCSTGASMTNLRDGWCLFSTLRTWYDASNDCHLRGGRLAAISDLHQQEVISDRITNKSLSVRDFFVALTSVVYMWQGGAVASPAEYFNVRQDFNSPPSKPCMVIDTAQSNQWDAVECNTQLPFVCQADIDECQNSPCGSGASCVNTPGSYTCACGTGYQLSGSQCQDVDECQAVPAPCDVDATCSNADGSYSCSCNSGYYGDGITCSLVVNECADSSLNNCSDFASCSDLVVGFSCACNSGYTGDGYTCTDVDECQASNNCSSQADCINTPGSYECRCKSGYTGDGFTCTATRPETSTERSAQTTDTTKVPEQMFTTELKAQTEDTTDSREPSTDQAGQTIAVTTTPGAVGPGTAGASTDNEGGLGTAEIILIVICVLLIVLIVILFVCVIYYKRKNSSKNKVTVDNNYDARPEAPVAYGGNIGEDYYYPSSENGSTSGLVPPKNTRASTYSGSHSGRGGHGRITVDDEKY